MKRAKMVTAEHETKRRALCMPEERALCQVNVHNICSLFPIKVNLMG